jgi:hypothetical protein
VCRWLVGYCVLVYDLTWLSFRVEVVSCMVLGLCLGVGFVCMVFGYLWFSGCVYVFVYGLGISVLFFVSEFVLWF